MTSRPYHHGDLRATMLTLAERTLRTEGPAGLSLRELAREAGVSSAAPLRHFKGKQALLDALALDGFDRLAATLTSAIDEAGDVFADRLDALARAYLDFAVANGALLDLMYGRKHETTAPDELRDAKYRLGSLAADLIAEGQQRGEVRAGSLESLTGPLTATLQGMTAIAISGGFTAEQIEISRTDTIAFTLRGLAP
ncbi:TetR/AcrR family transcriptional regulator [Hamadaea sp. NPDC051192]|uniref:TetR/AcrR family transcriptional regulator n=1 Tax=Hamadaea sp. NPDC051192 TaxID=3154940 RepID=UPI003412F13E